MKSVFGPSGPINHEITSAAVKQGLTSSQRAFLLKIIHRMRDDLAQIEQYEKVGILPDVLCLDILERVLKDLVSYLRNKFPKQKKKEASTLALTPGKILCRQIDINNDCLDEIRSYLRHRGVWTERARLLLGEIRAKSLELAKFIPLD